MPAPEPSEDSFDDASENMIDFFRVVSVCSRAPASDEDRPSCADAGRPKCIDDAVCVCGRGFIYTAGTDNEQLRHSASAV